MKKAPEREKVWVGLSGGVDSAVSAALLQSAGYEVVGAFIKIWSPEFLECTWREDRLDAMRVAVHLGIPFVEIDLSEEYRRAVIDTMVSTYKSGSTPNPDVLCNEFIKFGAFADWAFAQGADLIATGHYARVKGSSDDVHLITGIDPSKDQSYFLYRIHREVLARTLFPVGGFLKPQIREKARELRLPNAERPDSQGLCFVGDVSIQEFLSRFGTWKRGKVFDEKGTEIGEHEGASFYTIGQRHGFTLRPDAPSGPFYVIAIDAHKNELLVCKDRSRAARTQAKLQDVHWITTNHERVEAVPRYHAQGISAIVHGDTALLQRPVEMTPGQSLVFYVGEECVGGAVIHSTHV